MVLGRKRGRYRPDAVNVAIERLRNQPKARRVLLLISESRDRGQKGLDDAIEKLGAELHSQYVLSFAPEDSAPGYHKLEVSLARAGRFRIRARPGSWSTAEPR